MSHILSITGKDDRNIKVSFKITYLTSTTISGRLPLGRAPGVAQLYLGWPKTAGRKKLFSRPGTSL